MPVFFWNAIKATGLNKFQGFHLFWGVTRDVLIGGVQQSFDLSQYMSSMVTATKVLHIELVF
jgi:hypothetical protein